MAASVTALPWISSRESASQMDWKEYQDAVARLYEQADGIGHVRKNISIADRVTGQSRQVDVLIELDAKGHRVTILIDAKFHKDRVDVKTVEEVAGLATAVCANKTVIVCANGWTKPAEKFAAFSGIDLELMTVEDAVELLDPEKWQLCPICENDCIVMNQNGALIIDELLFWWIAGQCRQCKTGAAWCQECGQQLLVPLSSCKDCSCGRTWATTDAGMTLRLQGGDQTIELKCGDDSLS
jgi:Restriction endonuclease